MRDGGKVSFPSDVSFETRCDAMLLGRLGHELANIYHDTLQAPLPSGLSALIDRLETALEPEACPGPQVARIEKRFTR